MSAFLAKLAPYKKFVVAILGILAQAVASGLLTGAVLHWATVILAVATAFGVFRVPNDPALPPSSGSPAV